MERESLTFSLKTPCPGVLEEAEVSGFYSDYLLSRAQARVRLQL